MIINPYFAEKNKNQFPLVREKYTYALKTKAVPSQRPERILPLFITYDLFMHKKNGKQNITATPNDVMWGLRKLIERCVTRKGGN